MNPNAIEGRSGRGRRAERAPVDRCSFGIRRRGSLLNRVLMALVWTYGNGKLKIKSRDKDFREE